MKNILRTAGNAIFIVPLLALLTTNAPRLNEHLKSWPLLDAACAAPPMPPQPAGDPPTSLTAAYRFLERAVDMTAGNGETADPGTQRAIEEARETLRRAEDAIAAGRIEEGMRLTVKAREMLRIAMRAQTGEMTRERLMHRIDTIEALREEARNLVGTCPAPGVKDLWERAQAHVRLARDHAEHGDIESAAGEAAVARSLFQRISEICAR